MQVSKQASGGWGCWQELASIAHWGCSSRGSSPSSWFSWELPHFQGKESLFDRYLPNPHGIAHFFLSYTSTTYSAVWGSTVSELVVCSLLLLSSLLFSASAYSTYWWYMVHTSIVNACSLHTITRQHSLSTKDLSGYVRISKPLFFSLTKKVNNLGITYAYCIETSELALPSFKVVLALPT